MLRLHRLVDFRAAAEAAAVLGASAFAALLTGKSADSSDRLTAIVKSAPVPGLTAAQQAAALLTGLIPVAALHTWRALRRRRRRQMQVRRVAARICPPPSPQPLHSGITADVLLTAAAFSSAQPLVEGAPAAALRDVFDEVLRAPGTHPLAKHLLMDSAPDHARAAAMLACRVEALRRVQAAATADAHAGGSLRLRPYPEHSASHRSCGPVAAADAAADTAADTAADAAADLSTFARLAEDAAAGPTGSGDASVCKVCWDRPCDALLAPCGHFVACLECLAHMQRTSSTDRVTPRGGAGALSFAVPALRCPVCVCAVSDVLRTYTA